MRSRQKEFATNTEPLVLTIGHSTRTIDEFVRQLRANDVARVIDVRTIPRSRHNPQFETKTLADSLKQNDIGYSHLPGLGGLRHTTAASRNLGWRNASFRGFADYMQSPDFEEALQELIRLAQKDRVAIMCAEAVPWRCHRSLIADALVARGIRVEHIMNLTRRQPHSLTPFARVQDSKVTYPGDNGERVRCHKSSRTAANLA